MKRFFLILILLTISSITSAQKVGVVLSGGGAKGLYHVGILKALEENNVPIDYISGTSMGAIVAGLYAAGYSPWEIEKIAMGPDISMWVSGKMDPKYSYFYNKQPARPSMISFDIDLKTIVSSHKKKKEDGGVDNVGDYYGSSAANHLSNIIPSTQLDIGLMEYFSGANAISKENFDSLYIPFRCISLDAVTKTQRVWDKGNLSIAIRSSMSIPIIFSPVVIDTTVMFDGGVINNFPWKETVEAWNPDFVIGGRCVAGDVLDVSTPMGQAMALMISPTDYNLPDSLGVMIGRAVNVGMLDFSKAKEIIDLGYKDALAMMPEILKRTPRLVSKKERSLKRMAFQAKVPRVVFDEAQLINEFRFDFLLRDSTDKKDIKQIKRDSIKLVNIKNNQIKDNKKKHKESVIVDIEEFKHRYYRIITEGGAKTDFPYANYVDSTGLFDFDINLNRAPLLTVNAGLNISSATINQGYLGFSYRKNRKNTSFYNIDGYAGSFYISGQLSHRINFYDGKKDLYLYSTATYNNLDFMKSNDQRYSHKDGVYFEKNIMNEYYVSSLVGMPIGIGVENKFETRLAFGVDNFSTVSDYVIDDGDITSLKSKSTVLFSTINSKISSYSLDDHNYPKNGLSQEFSVSLTHTNERLKLFDNFYNIQIPGLIDNSKSLWGSIKYSRKQYFKLSESFSLGYLAEGVLSVDPQLSQFAKQNMAPVFQPSLFSKTVFFPEFQKYNYLAAGIMPSYSILENLELRAEAFVYWGDMLRSTDDSINYILSASLMYKLPFANVALSYNRLGIGQGKKDFLIFNFGVMLFNQRGVIY